MYKNVFHAAYVIVKKHGIRGAYQGLPATWLRNIPANSAFFGELKKHDLSTYRACLIFTSHPCGGFLGLLKFLMERLCTKVQILTLLLLPFLT